jgi:hypothetical protein
MRPRLGVLLAATITTLADVDVEDDAGHPGRRPAPETIDALRHTPVLRSTSVSSSRRRHRRLVTAIVAPLILVATILGAGPASADQFSPYPGTGVLIYSNQFGDSCKVEVGPIYDKTGEVPYAIIGGVQIYNCARRHYWRAYVSEGYGPTRSGPWYTVSGSQRSTSSSNAYSLGGILETPRLCGGGYEYYYTSSTIYEYSSAGAVIRSMNFPSGVPTSAVKAKQLSANGTC